MKTNKLLWLVNTISMAPVRDADQSLIKASLLKKYAAKLKQKENPVDPK
jgi:hypothetical protein